MGRRQRSLALRQSSADLGSEMNFSPISSSSAGNLYLLEDGDGHRLAIECGLSFKDMQRALDYGVTELDGVLLSHAHGDHARAAKDVMRAGMSVYADAETFVGLDLVSEHNAHAVEALRAFRIKGWHILPFDLRHDVPCLGFLVSNGEDKLLYVTDTAYVPYRFNGVTILAIEANCSEAILRESGEDAQRKLRALRYHMSIERVLGFLAVNDLSKLREIHLLHLSDAHSDAALFQRLVQEATGKPTYIAEKAACLG